MRDTSLKAFSVIAAILSILLVPGMPYSAGVGKLIPVVSVYDDGEANKLRQPEGVTCNEDLTFIIADSGNGRLLRFILQEGTYVKDAEIKAPQLTYPLKVKTNSKGEIFVLDSAGLRIIRLDNDGNFTGFIDPDGLPSPAEYVPRSFDIDNNDNIYILDIFSERVLMLDPDGTYRKTIPLPASGGFLSDLAVDFKGTVLLVDSINAKIFTADSNAAVFSPLTESLHPYMRYPAAVETGVRGRIYLTDKNGSLIVFLGQDGSFLGRHSGMGWKEGLLNHPSQICINDKGYAFVADTDNNRVQIFLLVR